MLGILLAIFFIWRFLFLIFTHPLYLFVYVEEEFYRGMIGKEILDGLKLAFYDYRADDYSGGSLFIGTLAAGFFKIFGENAFAFKLIPVSIFAVALAAWYTWIASYLNRRLAVLFSLVFIFSPFLFTRFSLTVLGDHPETIAFTALSLVLFFKILEPEPSHVTRNSIFLGLLSGFALWVAYIYGVTILTILLYWGIQDSRFWKRKSFRTVVLFFFVGFSPWILGNILSHFQGFAVQGTPLLECFSWKTFLKRIWNFKSSSPYLLFAVHSIPGVVPEISRVWVTRFYRVLFLLPPLLFFAVHPQGIFSRFKRWIQGHSPVQFSFLYLAVFLILCQMTEFKELRYFIPAQPFVFFLAVYAVDRFAEYCRKSMQKAVRYGYVSLLIAASLFLHIHSFYPAYAGTAFYMKPFSLYWILLSPVCATPQKCLETYQKFQNKEGLNPSQRELLKSGVTQKLLEDLRFQQPYAELAALKKQVPPELHPYCDYYFGYESYARAEIESPGKNNLIKTLKSLQSFAKGSPESHRLAVLGVFREPLPLSFFSENFSVNEMSGMGSLMPEDVLPEFWRRVGALWADGTYQKSKNYLRILSELETVMAPLSSADRNAFGQGVGKFFYEDWYLRPYDWGFDWSPIQRLPAHLKNPLLEGVGFAWASSHDLMRSVLLKMLEPSFKPDERQKIDDGIEQERVFFKELYRI